MSTSRTTNPSTSTGERSYFEQQREILLKEIGVSFEHVLANINKLNRSLEGVIAVGNEFGSVEALWSRFEEVTEARSGAAGAGNAAGQSGEKDGGGREERERRLDDGDGEGDGEGDISYATTSREESVLPER